MLVAFVTNIRYGRILGISSAYLWYILGITWVGCQDWLSRLFSRLMSFHHLVCQFLAFYICLELTPMAPTPHLCVNYYLCIQVPTYVPFVRHGPVGSLEKICLLLKLQVTLINHLGTWQGVQVSQLLRCSVVFPSSEEGTN